MKLSVIIVSWNVREKLKSNLRALLDSKTDFEFEVFVVDNNSEDGSALMVESDFPAVNLVKNDANYGFAKANNQVIRQLESDFILLLNPDMIPGPNTLQNMIGWMDENPQACACSCRLIDEKGETVRQIRRFPRVWDQLAIVLKLPHIFGRILDNYIIKDFDYQKAQPVDSIRGAFFMINRKRVYDLLMFQDRTLPELDERYFLWFEEVDYCRQIKKGGGEVWYTPAAECRDLIGKSFDQLRGAQKQKYIRDSMLKYFRKWHSAWEYTLLLIAWLLIRLPVILAMKLGIKGRAKT
jgi:hypothetical protein